MQAEQCFQVQLRVHYQTERSQKQLFLNDRFGVQNADVKKPMRAQIFGETSYFSMKLLKFPIFRRKWDQKPIFSIEVIENIEFSSLHFDNQILALEKSMRAQILGETLYFSVKLPKFKIFS